MPYLIYSIFAIFLSSCATSAHENAVPVAIDFPEIVRMDKALVEDFVQNKENFPVAFEIYMEEILAKPDEAHFQQLFQDSAYIALNEQLNKYFFSLEQEQAQLQKAMGYFKYYFPEQNIPRFYAVNSMFRFGNWTEDSVVLIGLDFYLGTDHEFVRRTPYPQYFKNTMQRAYMISDVLLNLVFDRFYEQSMQERFLEVIINYGKIMYILDCLLPTEKDFIKLKYTNYQWEWAKKNEKQVFDYILKNELLYTTDYKKIHNFVQFAPFSPDFGTESADRMGIFIGLQMVRQYMKNQKIPLKDLLKVNPSSILGQYKP